MPLSASYCDKAGLAYIKLLVFLAIIIGEKRGQITKLKYQDKKYLMYNIASYPLQKLISSRKLRRGSLVTCEACQN